MADARVSACTPPDAKRVREKHVRLASMPKRTACTFKPWWSEAPGVDARDAPVACVVGAGP
jgi:hypothetical protein